MCFVWGGRRVLCLCVDASGFCGAAAVSANCDRVLRCVVVKKTKKGSAAVWFVVDEVSMLVDLVQ